MGSIFLAIWLPLMVVWFLLFSDFFESNKKVKNQYDEFKEYDTVAQYFNNEEISTVKAIFLSIGKALLWVLFIGALLGSMGYVVVSFANWLIFNGSWVPAAISTIIITGWIAFFIYMSQYACSKDKRASQKEVLQKRKAKQKTILERLIKQDIDKDDAIKELNELYTIEAIQLVKTIQQDLNISDSMPGKLKVTE